MVVIFKFFLPTLKSTRDNIEYNISINKLIKDVIDRHA